MIEELLDQTQERRLDIIVTAILLPLVLTLAIPQVIPDWVRVVAGGLLVLAVLFLLLVGVLGRRARGYIGQNVAFTLPRQALLFTVGRQVSTIEFALANQRPAYVALLCTKDSQADAEAILAKQHLSDEYGRKFSVNGHDPKDVHDVTLTALDWLRGKGLKPKQIAIDVTGGLTTMSLGAFSAARKRRIDTQYVASDFADNKPVPGTQRGVFVERYSKLPRE